MTEQEQLEMAQLRVRLEETEGALRAIRSGNVDGVVVSGPAGEQLSPPKGAEQPYRAFVETMGDGAVSLLADGTVVYANQRFAALIQTPLARVIGGPLEAAVAPDDRHRVRALLDEALAGRAEAEIRLLTGSGRIVWAELSLCPARLENSAGVCLTARDITERRKTEDLRAYLASIVDNTDDAIIGKDLDGTILSWNRGAEQLYGYTAMEILGRSVSLLCPLELAEEPFHILKKVGRGQAVERYETERIRKDGRRIRVSVTISPIRDPEGRIEGASTIARDITALRRSEEELRQRAKDLKEAQRVAQLGSWSLDLKTGTVAWTEELYRMLGCDPALPPPAFADQGRLFTAESWKRLQIEHCQTLGSGVPYEVELEMLRADGSTGWMLSRGEPLRDAGGTITHLRGIAQDITRRKRAEEDLHRLNEDLERRVEERTAELQAVLDSAPTPIWIGHDPQCRNITGNAYADQVIMRVPRGGNISADAPAGQEAAVYKMFRKGRELRSDEMPAQMAAATARPVLSPEEVDLQFTDGRIASLLLSAVPLFNAEGKVRGVVAAGADVTDLRKAEQALRHSEERLTLALLASEEGVWDWNLETDEVWYSSRYKQMLGYSEDELESHVSTWKRLLHPDDLEGSLGIVQAVLRGKREYAMEFRLRHRDGHYIPILARGFPVRREAGGPIVRIVGTHFDLTERKRAEEELRHSKALHRVGAYTRSLIEASLDPLVTIDRDGKITDVNQSTELATGLAREALIGTDFSNYFADPQKAWEGYRQVFREGRVRDYELEIQHRDGHVTPVLYSASLYHDEAGEVAGVFAAARDISQRKRAEYAVLAERQRFFEVLETLPVMISLLTKDYHVAFANRSFRERFGDSGGRPCYEYCYGKSAPCEFCESFESFKTGRPHRWEVRTPEGLVLDVHDFPFTDADGAPMVLKMAFDITERRRNEEALARKSAELARSNAELQQFAYVASHDLQEPLRAVASFTKLLGERYKDRLDSDANEFISFAVDGAKRAQRLINDLLAYSRVGTRAAAFVPTNCETILEQTLADLAAAIAETAGQVTHDLLPTVQADPSQLGQVFQNLLANALKFHAAEPPRVHVSAERRGPCWLFSVRDRGIGIDPQFASRIFEVFQRLHSSSEYPGTGIGLAIVKKIVERHGGRIWVESAPGRGATFYFTVPVAGPGQNP